jgi:hypothetical protein
MYISKVWKTMPQVDCSGGNVTYAALSLAELLGAAEIELYGADFSYPGGNPYARGAYIHSWFEKSRHRFSPQEAQVSAFLYRTPLEKKNLSGGSWYYETQIFSFYRKKLEEKSRTMGTKIIPVEGFGAKINIPPAYSGKHNNQKIFSYGKVAMKAEEFLCRYRKEIAALRKPEKNAADYLVSLNDEERTVFATLLPAAAALKQICATENFIELIEETKAYCIKEIDKILYPGE